MLQKSTLTFLKDLKENNDRDWFTAHKERYEHAREDVLAFLDSLIAKASAFDNELLGSDPKKSLMRIYRDVRFSKDKSPYKTNFGIWLSGAGKNGNYPGYYLHIQPGNSFVAGGYWMPDPEHIKNIRQEIDYNFAELQSILKSAKFKKYFEGLDDGEKLANAPKGYPKDHPALDFLRMKSFTLSYKLNDKQLLDKTAEKEIIEAWKAMLPFNRYLQKAIKN